ncbi:hypothetical protein BKA62DRAFT_609801 [Auriculariales sp. MPI-PUGE-AT-0066]|nr:hypothetical protein BKA62DRAFT_609801 [Auriculariales sp. MPI-PUGE-AT-0066]
MLSSLTAFKRANSPAPVQVSSAPPTLIQDGSYLQALGLKLSEAVTKALALPTCPVGIMSEFVVDGKGPLPSGRGRCLGSMIASELRATECNVNLQRAFLRALQRALSILLTSINGHLLPLVSTPTFTAPFNLSAAGPFNPTQIHALALATFAGELVESLEALGLGTSPEASSSSSASANARSTLLIGDGLRPIREGLEGIISKVATPLFAQIRKELLPILEGLEHPPPAASPALKPTLSTKSVSAGQSVHPSLAAMTQAMPAYHRALAKLADLSPIVHRALASCLIALHWRAMISLAHRPLAVNVMATPPSATSPLPSSTSLATAISGASKKKMGGPTPPGTPAATRFLMKLPSSRPPSPQSPPTCDPLELEAKKVYDLLSSLPKPASGDALEAVEEGLEALDALVNLLRVRGDPTLVPEDVPTLVALPIVLRSAGVAASVPALTQLGEGEYYERCLGGFGRAAECGPIVARTLRQVLDNGDATRTALLEWLQQRAA